MQKLLLNMLAFSAIGTLAQGDNDGHIITGYTGFGDSPVTYLASVVGWTPTATTLALTCAINQASCIDVVNYSSIITGYGSTSFEFTATLGPGDPVTEITNCKVTSSTFLSCLMIRAAGDETTTQTVTGTAAGLGPVATIIVTTGLALIPSQILHATSPSSASSSHSPNAAVRATIISPLAERGLMTLVASGAGLALALAVVL